MNLRREIVGRFLDVPGAGEHRQIAVQASEADCFVLDDATVADLVWTLSNRTGSVEGNVDLVDVDRPVWIEFDNNVRRRSVEGVMPEAASDRERKPDRVGYLLAKGAQVDHFTFVPVWGYSNPDAADRVLHGLAVASFLPAKLGVEAYNARTRYDLRADYSLERMLGLCEVSVPDNFVEELKVLNGSDDEKTAATLIESRTATAGEVPFCLAAMLAVRSRNASLSLRHGPERTTDVAPPSVRGADAGGRIRGFLADIGLASLGRTGFVRSRRDGPAVDWRLPA